MRNYRYYVRKGWQVIDYTIDTMLNSTLWISALPIFIVGYIFGSADPGDYDDE